MERYKKDFEANKYLKSKERNWLLAPNEFRYTNYLLNVSYKIHAYACMDII